MAIYFWTSSSSTDPTVGANWTKSDGTTGTAPGNGDTAYIQLVAGAAPANISYADMHTVTLALLVISAGLPQSFTIGTTATTSADYFGFWEIGATLAEIGAPASGASSIVPNTTGPGRIKLNLGSAASTVNVFSTGVSTDTGLEPVRLLASSSSTAVNVQGGIVGIATDLPGQTSTIGSASASGNNTELDLGPGVTCTTASVVVNAFGFFETSPATVNVGAASTCTILGTGATTTLNNYGTCNINNRPASGATITTLNAFAGSISNFAQNPAAATIGTANVYSTALQTVQLQQFQTNGAQVTIATLNLFGSGLTTWN